MIGVDVIILSHAKTDYHISLTKNTIDSLIKSEDKIHFNIFLIENSTYQWKNLPRNVEVTNLVEDFNYNKFMNIGANLGLAEHIIFANNDLEFKKDFFTNLLKYSYDVMSPKSQTTSSQCKIPTMEGYATSKHVSGWCFYMKRQVWQNILGLDEDFIGWFADDSMIMQILSKYYKHYHIAESIVNHLDNGSNTLQTLEAEISKKYTTDLTEKFNLKYKRNKFNKNPEFECNENRFK